jgi:ubiquinone/menaquinone biosynthesis C-methylase UbiE
MDRPKPPRDPPGRGGHQPPRPQGGPGPGARGHLALGSASVLPFGDQAFDLVFTTGVLIHIARADLPAVMSEVVRCSRRYVLCGEYHAPTVTEIRYREQEGALFKDDYGRLYLRSHPELALVEEGFLARQQGGWDDITYWLFEKAR